MLTRRNLLTTTSVLAMGYVASASTCTLPPVGGNPNLITQALGYLQSILDGLVKALPTLGGIPGISAAVMNQIGTWVSDIQALVSSASTGLSTAGNSILAQIEAVLNSIVNMIGPILAAVGVATGPFGWVLTLAGALLPTIESLLNQFFGTPVATTPTPVLAARRSLLAATMTPDQIAQALHNPYAAR